MAAVSAAFSRIETKKSSSSNGPVLAGLCLGGDAGNRTHAGKVTLSAGRHDWDHESEIDKYLRYPQDRLAKIAQLHSLPNPMLL